jgi:hypothetical protein
MTRSGDWGSHDKEWGLAGSHEMYNSKVYNKQTEYSTYMECNDFREDQNEYYVKHHDSDTEIKTKTKQ